MQLAKGVQTLGRRVVTQAKNVRPARGGGGIFHENKHLTGEPHPGRSGNDWGTAYFPVGNSPTEKLAIGGGITFLVSAGVGIVYWSAWRQGQWSKN